MSHDDKLIYMANQIGKFFAAQGGAAEVENHLRKFWDKRMRAAIVAHLAAGGEGLDPLAREAVSRLAAHH